MGYNFDAIHNVQKELQYLSTAYLEHFIITCPSRVVPEIRFGPLRPF